MIISVPLTWEPGSVTSTISGFATASPPRLSVPEYIYVDIHPTSGIYFHEYKRFEDKCTLNNESSFDLIPKAYINHLLAVTEWGGGSGFSQVFRPNVALPLLAGSTELSHGNQERPKGYTGVANLRLQSLGGKIDVPAASVTTPVDIRVRMACTFRLFDDIKGEAFKYEIAGVSSGTIRPKTNISLELPPSLSFGSLPVGGRAVRELPLTIRSDGPYLRGTISYTADVNDGGINAKIGDGNLQLVYGAGHSDTGYVNLSGQTWTRQISGTAGDKVLMHSVYLNAPMDARLGTYRTNLRLRMRYD